MYEFGVVKINEIQDGLSNTLLLGEAADSGAGWIVGMIHSVHGTAPAGINRPSVKSSRNVFPSPFLQPTAIGPAIDTRLRFLSSRWSELRVCRRIGEVSQEHHRPAHLWALATRAGGEVVSAYDY